MNEKLLEIISELETNNETGEQLVQEMTEQIKETKKTIASRIKTINTLKSMMEEI